MNAPPDEAVPPTQVAGKYRLMRLLGRGGMGAVWEGVHESLGTRVAVKFIDAEYATSDDLRRRFVNEAKAAARLRSKHVVQVYDQGVGEDGRPFIVMEFLAGEPLDQRLSRLGRLAPKETARIALHVARALAKAHESGIVHRDLKPENVFLVRDEEDDMDIAKVVDFGIAKFTDGPGTSSSSTRTGAVLGTPQYMSPEQARGLRSLDHRTDLWSLGVIVYVCMTGALPFKGEAVGDLLVNICTADPAPPSTLSGNLPAGFDAWVRRALAREPSERFQSAAELSDSLAELCGLEARLGASATSAQEWVERPARAATPGAATGAPLSTTNDPGGKRRRPLAAVAAIFGAVSVGAFFVARSVVHTGPATGPEPSAALVQAAPSVPLASAVQAEPAMSAPSPSVEPAVTPAVAAQAPASVTAPAPASKPAGRSPARVQAAAPGTGAKSPPSKPQQKGDELGY